MKNFLHNRKKNNQPEVQKTGPDGLREAIDSADAILIGGGAGLSVSARFDYNGPVFREKFADFIGKYHYADMYSAGFYPYPTLEEEWAYWSRHIYYNRYVPIPNSTYDDLLRLVSGKNYFVLTTNVDHCFQKAGFDKERLFYTQGDYGLWQCSEPCHQKTYDNEETVRRMIEEQRNMRVPSELVPRCPVCGRPMTMNLRSDSRFVEDEGWHCANDRYGKFIEENAGRRLLFLELGVDGNTPGIIKYPFWQMTMENPDAVYACVNQGEAYIPKEIEAKSICINGDIGDTLRRISA